MRVSVLLGYYAKGKKPPLYIVYMEKSSKIIKKL